MKILVTGGSGFVGQNLTKRLVQDGHEVIIVSTGSEPKISGVAKTLYMGLTGIDWKYTKNVDVVFHQMANNDTLCTDKEEMFNANVYGAQELFEKTAGTGCKNFVYASSTAVYGASPAPYREHETPVKPLNVYGESKAKFDEYAMYFAKIAGVKVTGLRYCNIYGPGESLKGKRMSMIGQLIRLMKQGRRPRLFEFGEQKRDWIYVDDVVEMNIRAMNREHGEIGEIYNCGSGCASTFNEIVQTINEILGTNLDPEFIPCPFAESYQDFTLCEMEKGQKDLSFFPKYDLRSGISEYLKLISS